MFVFIYLLGPKEMVLPFAQHLSKFLVERYKLFPDISQTQQNEKNGQINFSLGMVALFLKLCNFGNLLGPKKMLIQFPK